MKETQKKKAPPRITCYLYDGPNIIQQQNGKGKITATYIHGPKIDEPLAIEDKGKDWYYYHADALGSIMALTDNHGRTVQTYSYDAFGNTKKSGNKVKQPFGFTGRELDTETGLYYYRARVLDTDTGKFTTRDPISFAGGDANLYRYVQNNPINFIDPSGLTPASTAAGLASGALTRNKVKKQCQGIDPSGKRIIAAAAGGAVSGAISGATGGAAMEWCGRFTRRNSWRNSWVCRWRTEANSCRSRWSRATH